jgi:hypothetical protein
MLTGIGIGIGFVVCCLSFVVCCLWFVVYGLLFVVCCLWFMVYGLLFVLGFVSSNLACREGLYRLQVIAAWSLAVD